MTDASTAIAELEAQDRLEPGTPGWWKVWGATPRDIRSGDIIMHKDGDQVVTEYVEDTFTAKAAPLRIGYVINDGQRFTLGALTPIVLLRKGTHNTLSDSVR